MGNFWATLDHFGSYFGNFGPFGVILGHFFGHFMAFFDKFAQSSNFFAAPLGSLGSLLECMSVINNLFWNLATNLSRCVFRRLQFSFYSHQFFFNLFSAFFYSRDLDRMKEILSPHPNSTRVGATREWRSVASQYFSTNIDSLAFFIALFYLFMAVL